MKRFVLKTPAKILLVLLAVAIIGVTLFKTGAFDKAKKQISSAKDKVFTENMSDDEKYEAAGKIEKEDGVINISLDEWIGYKTILDANGGLKTKKGSIYDELGLKVNISVINDATTSSNALIKGSLDGAGYTVNRYAFLYNKFSENNVGTKMGFITNSSTGGDGIISKSSVKSIEDLKGKTIGMPRYSESQALTIWLLNNSSLSKEDVNSILENAVYFETPDDCAKAFFSGKLDAAATWEPYLTQAKTSTDSKLLFSTESASNLILSGVVFREDFAENNKDTVSKLLEGALKAESLYKTDTTAIKNSFPMFSLMSDDEIIEMTNTASTHTCASNIELLGEDGLARKLFVDMSNIWSDLGESADPNNVSKAFTNEYATAIKDEFIDEKEISTVVSNEEKQEAQNKDNSEALLKTTLTINFLPDSTQIEESSYEELISFAEKAKVLDGCVIQIEGNTQKVDGDDGVEFSKKRAESVARFLQNQGIDASRFIIIGNGDTKPVSDTDATANRRTDIYFKSIGY